MREFEPNIVDSYFNVEVRHQRACKLFCCVYCNVEIQILNIGNHNKEQTTRTQQHIRNTWQAPRCASSCRTTSRPSSGGSSRCASCRSSSRPAGGPGGELERLPSPRQSRWGGRGGGPRRARPTGKLEVPGRSPRHHLEQRSWTFLLWRDRRFGHPWDE